MAKLDINEFDGTQLIAGYLEERTPPRSPGIHVSDIIADIVRMVPSLAKTLDMEEETRNNMWALGLIWEDSIQKYTGWPQVQKEVDGIVATCDQLVPVTPKGPCVDECKLTWKTSRGVLEGKPYHDIRDSWRWMTQAKSYCHVWNVRVARFWVCHVNGNYAPPQPQLIRYDLEFSDQEIAENWFMMTQHAGVMRQRAETIAFVSSSQQEGWAIG